MAIHVTDLSMEKEVIQCDSLVLLDFWAPWCGPCRMVGPVLEELEREYGGKLKVAKMNVDENKSIPAKYGIRAIPTLMLFKHGEVVVQVTGAISKTNIMNMIEKAA